MVHLTGDGMSEETAVAVALTKVDSKLELIQQSLVHQTELMSRNRDDASRDIAACKEDIAAFKDDITKVEARCDLLERINEQTKATVRTVTVIAGIAGTMLGVAASVATKFI